jgi:Right handed beta helix region
MEAPPRAPRRLEGRAATVLALILVVGAVGFLGAVLVGARGGGPQRLPASGAGDGADASYVARTNCDDARSLAQARDPGTPWCSLKRAVAVAPAGSEVRVAPGRYAWLELDGSDGEVHGVRLRSWPGRARAQLTGAKLTAVRGLSLSGFTFTETAQVIRSSDVRLSANRFEGKGIYIESSRDVAVVGNTIEHLRGVTRGLLAQGSADPAEPGNVGLVITRNRFQDIQHDALAVYNSHRDVRITDNVIRAVREPHDFAYHTDAMQLMGGDDVLLEGNVVTDVTHGILIKDGVPSSGLRIRGNLITDSPGAGLQIFNAPGTVVDHNTIWDTAFGLILDDVDTTDGRTTVTLEANVLDQLLVQAPGAVTGASGNLFGRPVPDPAWGQVAEPAFVDAAGGDYRLRRDASDAAPAPPGAQRALP